MSNTAQVSQKSPSVPMNGQQQTAAAAAAPQAGTQSAPPQILKEDDKMPLFLIKLWNIVEDPTFYDVIRWDDSGYSFHILDPYTFCRNVLPQYFKHNNLNSLIRQLNMYGFRKMTPIERTSLARLESDQDHLEFSHPYFVRDHPEFLTQIKRKTPTSKRDESVTAQPSKDLSNILEEMRLLRERQKNMEDKMNELITDNNAMYQQMTSMRGQHAKQQQIVNKLVQFLVTLVQPKRLSKRHMQLAIDEFPSPQKRSRTTGASESNGMSSQSLQTIQHGNLNEILDNLMKEITKSNRDLNILNIPATPNGPIISDVTDEMDHLSTQTGAAQFGQADFINPQSSGSANMGYDPNAYGYQNPIQAPMAPPVMQQQQQPPPPTSQPQQQPIPQVISPNTLAEEPFVLSPNGELGFNSNDFADYLNGVDNSIDTCRDLIGDHWNSFDFDNFLNSETSPPESHGFSQQPISLEQTHPQSVYDYPTNIPSIPVQQQQTVRNSPQMVPAQQPQQQQPQVSSSSYASRRKR